MANNIIKILIVVLSLAVTVPGCKKFLDEKSNQKLVVPNTVQDLQSLLDFYQRVNQYDPSAAERSADNYYLTGADWAALDEYERRLYVWEKEKLFPPGGSNDWTYAYDNVYRANVVLDNIDRVGRTSPDGGEWDNLKGHALFIRAKAFLQVAYVWSVAYDPLASAAGLGVPLRLTSDFNVLSTRPSIEETYRQVLVDLKTAAGLLPESAAHVLRPSKAAAFAMLSRAYLSMGNYDSAATYATLCLRLKDTLLDYNSPAVNVSANYPFGPRFSNPEIIMDNSMAGSGTLTSTVAKVDSVLYRSYAPDDLRKSAYFRSNSNGTYRFKGSYVGAASLFSGIATDEVHLTLAECFARKGDIAGATGVLNRLLEKRYKSGTFVPYQTLDRDEALSLILQERRKELCFRGLRWADIKRLNREGVGISLRRVVNGEGHVLVPNDLRFALPIPEDVLAITGMPQNHR